MAGPHGPCTTQRPSEGPIGPFSGPCTTGPPPMGERARATLRCRERARSEGGAGPWSEVLRCGIERCRFNDAGGTRMVVVERAADRCGDGCEVGLFGVRSRLSEKLIVVFFCKGLKTLRCRFNDAGGTRPS